VKSSEYVVSDGCVFGFSRPPPAPVPLPVKESAAPRLRVRSLTKLFYGVEVLKNLSFEAHAGRILGIVGENGSGKSTAMNVLTGVLAKDGGSIELDGSPFGPTSRRASDAAGIAFIQQELNVFPNLSVAENLFLLHAPRSIDALPFMSRRKRRARAKALLERLELPVSPDAPAGLLSVGERQLLEIGRGLAREARVFILDEPTTSLTEHETTRLFEILRSLRKNGVAILYISHNLDHVLDLSDDLLVLRDGRVTLASPRAQLTAQDLIVAMVGRPIETLFPARSCAGGTEVRLEAAGLSSPGRFRGVSLSVHAGEIVGLAGLMGSGRTELARCLFGLDPYSEGCIRVAGERLTPQNVKASIEAGCAFLTEDRRHEGLMLEASVFDNLALAALPLYAPHLGGRILKQKLARTLRELTSRLHLKSGAVESTPVRTLSGGNQQKVVLGRWLLRQPKVLILDEPTRGVDIAAKEEIYRLLAELANAGMAIFLISSELEELTGLSDRILVMHAGALVARFTRREFDRETILRAAFGHAPTA